MTTQPIATPPELPAYDHQPEPYDGPSFEEVRDLRQTYLTPALVTYYKNPIMIVEGSMQYLYDEKGRRYLDAFGGIVTVSVGHCHPEVTEAAITQMRRLQHATTIYLHPTIAEYGKMMVERLPAGLDTVYVVNSGSDANDLALLMARLYTGNWDVMALRNGYHGGNQSAMGLTAHSTWKYNTPSGFGIHHVANPDPYRGPWGRDDPDAAKKYANDLTDHIQFGTSGNLAGFFAESIQGVGGAVTFAPGYLQEAQRIVQAHGGLYIADEVQAGFARTGTHFWGFESEGVQPDIVTMAKGIGNGAPLACVATRREIAETLTSRVHFNTYGGNPVSCAMGKAVLEVIDRENILQNARVRGEQFFAGMKALEDKHTIIGDVRGRGLMLGIELVKDRAGKEPASAECAQVFERCKELGLLLGKGGLHGNTLRIKPPMCITEADMDFMLQVVDRALSEV